MFSKLMEDGEVIDTTTSRVIFRALTSVHLDTNRVSQVRTLAADQQDIDIPVIILSRFDFVAELERGEESQLKVAEEILRKWGKTEATPESTTERDWKRVLKRIVAYIRTYFRQVEIPDDISEYMVERINEVWTEMKDEFPDQEAITDFSARTSVSVIKYVKAITSASLGTVATKDDIDEAISFVQTKLQAVLRLRAEIPAFEKPKSKAELRQDFIRRTFGGETVTADQVVEVLRDDGMVVSKRTVERDFDVIAEKVAHGEYMVTVLDRVRLTN